MYNVIFPRYLGFVLFIPCIFLYIFYMSGDVVYTKSPDTFTLHKLQLDEIHLDHIQRGGCLYTCSRKENKKKKLRTCT